MKILLIIPAYNEEENILDVYKNIIKYNRNRNQKLDYVIVNDCSKDSTLKILKDNNINYINLNSNLGIGGAVQAGYKYAYTNNYDIAIQFDGDGQHDINFITNVCRPIISNKLNMCIGSRFLNNETSKFKSSFMRRIGKNLISIIINIFNGVKITDPTSGFRAIDKDIIRLFSNDYPVDYPEPESIVNAINHGYKVGEVPVSMKERSGGKSSINLFKSIQYMIKVPITLIIESINLKEKKVKEKK